MLKKTIRISLMFLLIIFGLYSITHAQQDTTKKIIQFSGLVVTADSLTPIAYTHIIDKTHSHGTVSDYKGFFSIVAKEGDLIVFSAVGFKNAYYRIPDTLSSNRYTMFQVMQNDTIYLTETVIYPWPTYEQFKKAFVTLDIPDDDLERARKNLALAEMKERMNEIPMDGSMNYKEVVAQQVYNASYQGLQKPSLTGAMNNPLLNPFAWAEFFKAWKRGDFKRK